MRYEIHKTKNYTVMSNYHLRDINLSLKAKGLLSMMLSLPDNWNFSVMGITKICKESKSTVETVLQELKDNGYLVVEKLLPNKTLSGQLEYVYHIYEQPQICQGVQNQPIENQGVENQSQLNTNKLNTNNKERNIKESTDLYQTVVQEFNFSQQIRQSIDKWIAYKKEKKQNYKEIGLRTLLGKIKTEISIHGERSVLSAIDNAIASNWSGIYFNANTNNNNQISPYAKYGIKKEVE